MATEEKIENENRQTNKKVRIALNFIMLSLILQS